MSNPSNSIAFVFPGQGSQSLGMLNELADRQAQVRQVFAEASEGAQVDLWALAQNGPVEQLNRTEFTQPALLAASIAVWRVWLDVGGSMPSRLAGHSLGEYSALVAAGALSLHDAARLVRERGRLMQAAAPDGLGAMAAVIGADDAVVAECCAEVAGSEVVAPANYNAPGQVVIGGHAAAVDRALALLAERGVRKAVKLAVSVPSHTALMGGTVNQLGEAMHAVHWQMPAIPVVQNVDAVVHADIAAIQNALLEQIRAPVRWTDCVRALVAGGAERIGECGPGKVLAGLIKRIDKDVDVRALGSPAELDAAVGDWNTR